MADGKRRKTIITVQHTQSEHHVNGYIGAQGNWNLTELGKTQADHIGKLRDVDGKRDQCRRYVDVIEGA